VPSLYRKPEPIAADLLRRVNAVAQQKSANKEDDQLQGESRSPRDEAVAVIGPDKKVEIEGLAAALSNGTYSYAVRSLSRASQQPTNGEFEKLARSVTLTLPSDGLFEVSITDRQNTPRVNLLIAAIPQPRAANMLKSFQDVKVLLKDWNEDYQGWPVHEFQRYYLRSLMLGIQPIPRHGEASPTRGKNQRSGATAEPRFSPFPGVFRGDTEVRLQCDTQNAVIHYTVDGSQPLEGSAVYRAPIVVKGTALTIKAFASVSGKKDSPVVTGIFRIGD
jgi:hypothetical protein